MKKVAVIDYGLGNIFSIRQALQKCGAEVIVTDSAAEIEKSDGILLPGVGAYSDAMLRLKKSGLDQLIIKQAKAGKPVLGICLGMQLLFEKSHEFGENPGLGLIEGEVIRFPDQYEGAHLNIPFIGWNKLKIAKTVQENKLLTGILNDEKFYFVHSYHVQPKDASCIMASCNYLNYVYPAIINSGNITGVQGHPEKSAEQGLKLYQNWLNSL